MCTSVHRVVAAYKKANQPSGARQITRQNALPMNSPRGISKGIQQANGVQTLLEDSIKPDRRDILPKDVFPATSKNTGVLNLVQTGNDSTKALKQIPKDKGYDEVSNLSQYLIKTRGV